MAALRHPATRPPRYPSLQSIPLNTSLRRPLSEQSPPSLLQLTPASMSCPAPQPTALGQPLAVQNVRLHMRAVFQPARLCETL